MLEIIKFSSNSIEVLLPLGFNGYIKAIDGGVESNEVFCDIDDLVMAADFFGISVQGKLREYRAQLTEKNVKKFS